MRDSTGPVSRSSRVRSMLSATSAAFPPAAWPPMPSITMNSPRAASTYRRSSFTARCRPGSVLPAAFNVVTERISHWRVQKDSPYSQNFSEFQKHDIGQADASDVWQRGLRAVLTLLAIHLVITPRHVTAVQGAAERAKVNQIKGAALRIPPDARVLARDVGRRDDLDVHWIGNAAAPDHHRVSRHLIRMLPHIVQVFDASGDPFLRAGRLDCLLAHRCSMTGMNGRDAPSPFSRTELGSGGQPELRVHEDSAFLQLFVRVGQTVDVKLGASLLNARN